MNQQGASNVPDQGKIVGNGATSKGQSNNLTENVNNKEEKQVNDVFIGPEEDELNGLLVENWKRPRNESRVVVEKGNNINLANNESGFSNVDYTDFSSSFLATLARQASH